MNKMTTKITSSSDKSSYDIHYTCDGVNYKVHKKNIKSLDDAIKETTIVNGSFKLLSDVMKGK
jgi:hypothetical protein